MKAKPLPLGPVAGTRWTALNLYKKDKHPWVDCVCSCGTHRSMRVDRLHAGRSRSCGCLQAEGLTPTREKPLPLGRWLDTRWTLIRRVAKGKGDIKYVCLCDCGVERTLQRPDLLSGRTKSCGCLRAEKLRLPAITGHVLGTHWTVIAQADGYPKDNLHYSCRCVCGTLRNVCASKLRLYKTLSCGCRTGSKGENMVAILLSQKGIAFDREYRHPSIKNKMRLPFDFALKRTEDGSSIIAFIEYDGKQHDPQFIKPMWFAASVEARTRLFINDKIKTDSCAKLGIPLLRIDHTYATVSAIEPLLSHFLYNVCGFQPKPTT
jgi:hypothetical protein